MSPMCHEAINPEWADGDEMPCNATAVALRRDEEGHTYPVCVEHVRDPMAPLDDIEQEVLNRVADEVPAAIRPLAINEPIGMRFAGWLRGRPRDRAIGL